MTLNFGKGTSPMGYVGAQSPLGDLGVRIPRRKYVGICDVVDRDTLTLWAAKLYTLHNLAWQYIETILDIACQMRIRETKPLIRKIRELHLEYDRFRARSIDGEHCRHETDMAESFEDWLAKDLRKLFYALDFEVSKMDIVAGQRPLVIAVHQAMAMLEAVKIYARRRDKEIREKHRIEVKDCSLISNEFLALYPLVPQFAGDCYRPDLDAVKITANKIANKIEDAIINILPD